MRAGAGKLQLGDDLLELRDILAQLGHFIRRRLARDIADQALLACFETRLAPPVVEIRVQPFTPTQRRDALFAPHSLEDNPDLLFS